MRVLPPNAGVFAPQQQASSTLRPHKSWTRLDNKSCQGYYLPMLDIQVIDDPAAATIALEPVRSRLLSELAAPASAATLATRVGLPRQKVNYHLRALETHGLVRLAHQRKWGGLTERLRGPSAASKYRFLCSPRAVAAKTHKI